LTKNHKDNISIIDILKVIIVKHSERVRLAEKYRHGREIDPEDWEKIYRLNAIGLIRMSVSIKGASETAKTTPDGVRILLND
jgi:hypothetical protein